MSTVTKLAAVREPGHPIGESAPCWFTCPCGAKHRAFQESIACACGARWTADGYRRAPLSADPVALVDHVISLMEGPMPKPKPAAPVTTQERDDAAELLTVAIEQRWGSDEWRRAVRALLAKIEGTEATRPCVLDPTHGTHTGPCAAYRQDQGVRAKLEGRS